MIDDGRPAGPPYRQVPWWEWCLVAVIGAWWLVMFGLCMRMLGALMMCATGNPCS